MKDNIHAYLLFDGTCTEAMRFYAKVLGGTLDMQTHGQSPLGQQASIENSARILHARLELPNDGVLMASDTMAGQPYGGMKGFAVAAVYPDVAEAKRVFDALSEGARVVTMAWEKTFWAEGFGMLTDKFGTPWIVNGGLQG